MEWIKENPAWAVIAAIVVTLTLSLQLLFVSRFEQLHSNICTAVAQSAAGNAQQYSFWTQKAQAATLRAKVDTDPKLKAIDSDSADQDEHIAAVFAPHPGVTFPGC